MKFYNGQFCKKPFSKRLLVFGIVLLSVSLLMLLILLPIILNSDDPMDIFGPFAFFGVCFIPGLVLLIIAIVKIRAISKKNREMLTVDYREWREKHLNDPSDPLYSVNCNRCHGLIEYDYQGIDGTRAWFPNGYVICPNCNTIMRHDAIKAAVLPQQPASLRVCTRCGAALPENTSVCPACGFGM